VRRAIRYAANGKVGRNVAGLIDTPKGRDGRRRRAFTLAQAAALVIAARSRPVLELHGGLQDSRRPASLMHAYIVVSLLAGVRPEEARAIGWEQDVDLDGDPPSVAVLRGPGARGRYEDAEVAPRAAAGADGGRGAQGVAGRPIG
jgi:hypothetical protein